MAQTASGGPIHDALRACIGQARLPTAREIEQLAARIWNEIYRVATGLEWGDVPAGSRDRSRAICIARAALGMEPSHRAMLSIA